MEVEFKSPPHENGSAKEESHKAEPEVNGTKATAAPKTPEKLVELKKPTRSRSRTPQKKKRTDDEPKKSNKKAEPKETELNGKNDGKQETEPEKKDQVNGSQESKKARKTAESNSKEVSHNASFESEPEKVDMDPLVLISDEPDPELQFDENSDMESGKGSPVLTRCKTRRSQTRNIPTPKTPRSIDDQESDKTSVAPTPDITDSETETPLPQKSADDTLNETDASGSYNLSTRAEVGSDITRMDYMANESELDDSYLNAARERSLSETLRGLSSRRAIRPMSDDYLKRTLKRNHEKSELNVPYPLRHSVDRLSVGGTKRKSRSESPEQNKKFKPDTSGFISLLSSPLNSIRNKFSRTEVACSTPKLTGYKDKNSLIDYAEMSNINVDGSQNGVPERKWCSIM